MCGDLAELRRRLAGLRDGLAAAAEASGCRLAAMAAPVLPGEPPPIPDSPRYWAIAEDQGVCGCHVHVGMPDRRTAVAVGTLLRPWMPALLALTAGSPLRRGRDTGYASWRSVLWSRWPVSGPTPPFDSPKQYDAVVHALVMSGVVLDPAQVYWTVRPSEQHPTLEVRVTDVCATVDEALVRGLAVEWVAPALAVLGDLDEVEHLLDRLRAGGSNAGRQRAVLREGGALADVVDTLVVVPA